MQIEHENLGVGMEIYKIKKNYNIQLLRFIFCLAVVNYHFYSLFLRFEDQLPNYFCRGYLADEFFFMVSGFFVAHAAVNSHEERKGWTLHYIWKRICKIAAPYYFSWLLCFVGGRIADYLQGRDIDLLNNILNSVYELSFLEMFGFTKGLYSNSVGWYFSALIISILVFCPLIEKYKQKYCLHIAPICGLFLLGMLSLDYDYLFWPHKTMSVFPILKGTVRAFSEVNLGFFLYGLCSIHILDRKKLSLRGHRITGGLLWILWIVVIVYMIFPFESNFDEPIIQYDYIFTLIIFVGLYITFETSENNHPHNEKIEQIEDTLGQISVYIFFGQPILYTLYEWFFKLQIRVMVKYVLYYGLISIFTMLVYGFCKLLYSRTKKDAI